jgi:hypothetical protein
VGFVYGRASDGFCVWEEDGGLIYVGSHRLLTQASDSAESSIARAGFVLHCATCFA